MSLNHHSHRPFVQEIASKISHHTPVTRDEATNLFIEASDLELMHLASLARARFHRPDEATYLVMAIVNYTNICVAKCDYCSFYRLPHDKEGYLLSTEDVCKKVDALVQHGGKLVGFNGGFHPKLRIDDYAQLFKDVRSRYPQLEFYEMTVAEFMFSCKVSKISYQEGAQRLAASGTRWVTGGGSEILDNNFRRRHSPGKYTVEDYFDAQSAILNAGMGSTATMVIGFDETLDERFNHLEQLRDFQDRMDGGLASFLCWTYKPWHNQFGNQFGNQLGRAEISTQEYLRWLAVARIYLHNIVHIRTSVLTKNAEALRGLQYGANDFDLPTEDEVTQKAGATINLDFENILSTAKSINFNPLLRDPWPVRFREFSQQSTRINSISDSYSAETQV